MSGPVPGSLLWAHVRDLTRAAHEVVESAVGLPGSATSRVGYQRVLEGLLSAWEPLEAQSAGAPGWREVPVDPDLGRASQLLRRDLEQLRTGVPAHRTLPSSTRAVPPPGLGHAIGIRYVLLGSALGGRVLAPVIEAGLDLAHGEATSFLRRDGLDPVVQWRQFRASTAAYLDRTADAALQDDIVDGALTAFARVTSAFS